MVQEVQSLPRYYKDVAAPQSLSKEGRYHFERKIQYLRDPALVDATWFATRYMLDRHRFSPRNKKVLDLGCGTGFITIYFAAAGASEAVGLDARASKTDAFRAYVAQLPRSLQERIRVWHARSEDIDCEDYFDLVFAQEAISHIADDLLFERLWRSLRKGGALFISDHNNVLYRPYREEMLDYWERTENGPVGPAGHHFVEWAYRDLRKDAIAEWFGDLSEKELNALADNTSGLYGDALRQACEGYVSNGVMPGHRYERGTPPVHPTFGYYMEKMFSPYELRRQLLDIGFSKVWLHGAEGISKSRYIRPFFKLIPRAIKYRLRPGFMVYAVK